MERAVSRRYSESFREQVVSEVESGRMSCAEASREYGISKSLMKNWLNEYGKFRPQRSIVEVVMKSEKEKISELEKALSEAHLKLRLYDKMLELAGKKYKTDLKKTFGNQVSEGAKDKGGVSK